MEKRSGKVLELVYRWYSESGPAFIASKRAVEEECGMSRAEVENSLNWLIGKGFIELWQMGDCVRITEKGITYSEKKKRIDKIS
ncbi:MAG TPA: hypothetical protein VII00_02605 [bacterium]